MGYQGVLGIAFAVAALALPATAPAATTIGQTAPGEDNCGEDAGVHLTTATAPGTPSYAVPGGGGVITSWQHDAAATTATENPMGIDVRLKVFRQTGTPGSYLTVGESPVETLASGGLKTFPAQISVQSGDRVGFAQIELGRTLCTIDGFSGDEFGSTDATPDPPVGSTVALGVVALPIRVNVAATVEPDADGDGFGDETQDVCPTEGDTQAACVPPETTITKQPKDKTKKKKATFEFVSNEPGSTFRCAVDGQALKVPCTSPHAVKVKKGKHDFEVQAVDPGGTADSTPASGHWKVKKKKKKKKK